MATSHSNQSFPTSNEIVIFRPEMIEFGGEERLMLALADAIHEMGRASCIACYYDLLGLGKYANRPIKVYQLLPKRNPFFKVISLSRFLKKLHQAHAPTPILFSIQSAYHAGLAATSPYHIWIPDTYSLLSEPDSSARFLVKLQRRLKDLPRHLGTTRGVQVAKRFITNTKVLQSEMETLYGRKPDLLYLGGSGSPLKEIPARSHQSIHLLSVCRLQPSKRIDWALRALASQTDLPPWFLHIVGSGPESPKLMSLASDLGIADRVKFYGFVDDANLVSLYHQAHIFIIPARQGFGLPALEALYQYVAVVISDESGVVEILHNTPWVAVTTGGARGFSDGLRAMMHRVLHQEFFQQPLPPLPTEKSWARELIQLCEW